LLPRPSRAYSTEEQRAVRTAQLVWKSDAEPAGDALVAVDVQEPARPQPVIFQGASQPLAGGARAPDVERPAAQGTAREMVRAQPHHPVRPVGIAGAGQPLAAVAPLQQHFG